MSATTGAAAAAAANDDDANLPHGLASAAEAPVCQIAAEAPPAAALVNNDLHAHAPPQSPTCAATTIQRTYRGHRARRELRGHGLDASTRWTELIKQAEYTKATNPTARAGRPSLPPSSRAQSEWKRLATVARYAGNDDTSDTNGEPDMTPDQLQDYRRRKLQAKQKREQNAKMMGLEYFLEMVDTKHRYGSHLRSYHAEWRAADTRENFFYWLDEGAGRHVELAHCSREKLDRDQVRYLTREERYMYRVNIDKQGRLRWAKNGEYVVTSPDFRDSLDGIVPQADPTPAYREVERGLAKRAFSQAAPQAAAHDNHDDNDTDNGTSSAASTSGEDQEGQHYVNRDLHEAKGIKKVQYISAAALLNHLLQSTTKKNTWIFVADTSFRLYIGIKQSGAFQHSSFLRGSRICAAGLIKVKDGQLRSLSPLSGHYRPPTRNFRAFVHSLKSAGVDMSRVSISKSYAVLLGLEGYKKSQKRAKSAVKRIEDGVERVLHPEQAKLREERELDQSASARREREVLEEIRQRRQEEGWSQKLSLRSRSHGDGQAPAGSGAGDGRL